MLIIIVHYFISACPVFPKGERNLLYGFLQNISEDSTQLSLLKLIKMVYIFQLLPPETPAHKTH